MAVFAVAVAAGDIIKYQSFVYGSFVWGIHVRYNKIKYQIHRGSYMSAHVLLNLLNELGKRDKMRGLPSILSHFFATGLINSIIQAHEC